MVWVLPSPREQSPGARSVRRKRVSALSRPSPAEVVTAADALGRTRQEPPWRRVWGAPSAQGAQGRARGVSPLPGPRPRTHAPAGRAWWPSHSARGPRVLPGDPQGGSARGDGHHGRQGRDPGHRLLQVRRSGRRPLPPGPEEP